MRRAAKGDGGWDATLRWRGLVVVSAAMVISAIDMTIVNVALPDISRELDASLGELQWVLDGFLVALAGLLAVASGVADRFGRRRVFLVGMGAFGATSLLCAVAPSIEALRRCRSDAPLSTIRRNNSSIVLRASARSTLVCTGTAAASAVAL